MMSAVEIAEGVRTGVRTARAVVTDALDRIGARDPGIGAFQVVRREAALREADVVDGRADRLALSLAGVPVAIKDNVPIAGEPMRVGSAASDPAPQPRDHEVVRRLRGAGAIVVGLTAVPELCLFAATDSVFGTTRNPWNPAYSAGGSSGGSAAAVSAGMVPIAHGNDGLGSIRMPAACCGLVGLKPGRGVVPSDIGDGSWFGMAENGALATTVSDLAVTTSVLAGRADWAEPADPGRLRIAVSTRSPVPGVPIARAWANAARRVGTVLRESGHTVRQANPPYGQRAAWSALVRWFAAAELDARLLADRARLDARTRRHAAIGRLALRAGLPREAGRTRWQDRAERFFGEHDVLLTPTLARAPLRSIAWHERGWLANVLADARFGPFPGPWNLAGWPAAAVPAGLDGCGLPLSVQLVGRPGSEPTLLGLAAQLEQANPWPRTATPW